MALEQELALFRKNINDWTEYEGQYVLIKGDEVIGFYSSYDDAITDGYTKFKLEPFLVKGVRLLEQLHLVSRYIDPCRTLPAK